MGSHASRSKEIPDEFQSLSLLSSTVPANVGRLGISMDDSEDFADEFSEPPEGLIFKNRSPRISIVEVVEDCFFEENGRKWIVQELGTLKLCYEIESCLFSKITKYQRCDIIKTKAYGIALFLDGVMNSAESDEYIYHESLVHPAMLAHPDPCNVFIGGGAEGATLREVLKYASVEKVVMADIDGELVEFFRERPEVQFYHQGSFNDHRVQLIYDDAKTVLEGMKDASFDIIILDLADPIAGGPALPLWTKEYYETCFKKLTPKGILVTQAGPLTNVECAQICSPCANTMKAAGFSVVEVYGTHVPSFPEAWAFVIAHKKKGDLPWRWCDQKLDKRTIGGVDGLKFYDGKTHQGLFALPKDIRRILEVESKVATLESPMVYGGGKGGIHSFL